MTLIPLNKRQRHQIRIFLHNNLIFGGNTNAPSFHSFFIRIFTSFKNTFNKKFNQHSTNISFYSTNLILITYYTHLFTNLLNLTIV